MAEVDPRTPVIVGAGQVTHRRDDDGDATALSLAVAAIRRAAADAGPGEPLLRRAQLIAGVETFSWPVHDPAARMAAELGLQPDRTIVSARGGTSPIDLLGHVCEQIAGGALDVGIVAGGEAFSAMKRAQRDGTFGDVGTNPPAAETIGKDADPSHAGELAANLLVPVVYYPLFEHALRASAGRTPAEHTAWLASWWSRYSDVAAQNPYAWTRTPMDAAAVQTPSAANRRVTDPYLKVMNANISVDQGAALIVCSVQAARDAGVPRDRWVFVHATGHAHDHWFTGERERLDRSPAIAASAGAALAHAGAGIDDIAHIDLYSCFPSAVQVAAAEMGLDVADPARVPTVTGGLGFFGGPASNYVGHSLATIAERLRDAGKGLGLATAVGWYLTKHGAAVLGAQPPARPFRAARPQDEVDAGPRVPVLEDLRGPATVETYTTTFDHDGTATMGIIAARSGDGGRVFAASTDPPVAARLADSDPLGVEVQVDFSRFSF